MIRNQSRQSAGLRATSQSELRLFVIYTKPAATASALRTATELAAGLSASVTLLAAQEVPFPLPINKPPVAVEFTENLLRKVAKDNGAKPDAANQDMNVQLVLCRDRCDAILDALPAASLVVIRGERRLAKALARDGHQVIV